MLKATAPASASASVSASVSALLNCRPASLPRLQSTPGRLHLSSSSPHLLLYQLPLLTLSPLAYLPIVVPQISASHSSQTLSSFHFATSAPTACHETFPDACTTCLLGPLQQLHRHHHAPPRGAVPIGVSCVHAGKTKKGGWLVYIVILTQWFFFVQGLELQGLLVYERVKTRQGRDPTCETICRSTLSHLTRTIAVLLLVSSHRLLRLRCRPILTKIPPRYLKRLPHISHRSVLQDIQQRGRQRLYHRDALLYIARRSCPVSPPSRHPKHKGWFGWWARSLFQQRIALTVCCYCWTCPLESVRYM